MNICEYFLIGAIFTLFLDLVIDLTNHPTKFNWLERIMCIIVWPITIVTFIYAYIKQIINNR